uniref:CNH domain-containing protein n=1 Tax=Mucochytrium quahogii TaxID=96639 RepID=A0A7S2RV46_9STRA|mmetsp:Transcript_21354/g.34772  ORF Transcript_21354/g.34772 Transcript_21354/m.34772 type:complete len:1172 (+) Transcript_21354:398-3913(+)|eukprot:CAMPEP_0203750130 /NCGR_PEP_ID=MMETSP0098-20131031/4411_1 /ASSEMBLY_ACC=CAM_ASM_000208 /TAXON_ID=96639 /ORGANISM=" , Strain NY0313808BC1" /LENGTH=1171 /DNA_ID=CAMNT_0050639285 /DNA_START=352 /DNA_END=3867 /DNA_ORIENTATION=+
MKNVEYVRQSQLLAKCTSKIESIAVHVMSGYLGQEKDTAVGGSHEERLTFFIGTQEGSLLVYETVKQNQVQGTEGGDTEMCTDDVSFRLSLSLKRFNPSKKAVSQLTVVDRWGMLLSVIDGELASYSLVGDPLLAKMAGGPSETIQLEGDIPSIAKDVLLYSVNAEAGLICIVCKRTLTILRWKPSNPRRGSAQAAEVATSSTANTQRSKCMFSIVQQITTPETARAVQWAGPSQICVGYVRDYVFFDAHTGVELKKPRMRTGARKYPIMCFVRSSLQGRYSGGFAPASSNGFESPPLSPGEDSKMTTSNATDDGELLLCKDNNGYFIGFDGLPARAGKQNGANKGTSGEEFVVWSEQPTLVTACQPYIIALLPKRIEVHLASSCKLCQTIKLPGYSLVTSTVNSSATSPQVFVHGTNGRKGMVFVASDRQIHVLVLNSLSKVVEGILQNVDEISEENFEEALELCNNAKQPLWDGKNSDSVTNNVYIGSGINFDGLELLQATVHARYSLYFFTETAVDPCFKTALKHLEQARIAGRLPLEFVTMLFGNTELFESADDDVALANQLTDLREELGAMFHSYLQNSAGGDTIGRSPPALAIDYETDFLVPVRWVEEATGLSALVGKELSSALLLLFLPYLLDYRKAAIALVGTDIPENNNQLAVIVGIVRDLLGVVDTLLLRAFVLCDALSTSRVANIAKNDRSKGKGNDGSKFQSSTEMRALSARMMEQKMLFLREANWCHIEDCEKLLLLYPEMWEELLWLYYGKGLHENALKWLYKLERNERNHHHEDEGPRLRALSANSSPYIAKTIEYLRNLGREHTDIILKYSVWVINCCNMRDALSIFTNTPRNVQPLDHKVVIEHLEKLDQEAIVTAVKENLPPPDPLAVAYVDYLISTQSSKDPFYHNKLVLLYVEAIMHMRAATPPPGEASKPKLEAQFSEKSQGWVVVDGCVEHHPRVAELRQALLSFLRSSTYYSAADLVSRFQATDLYSEYAIILSKLGRHSEALNIYVNDLNSYKQAEEYCESMYVAGDPQRNGIFLLLLEALVENNLVDKAIHLAEAHFMKVDPMKALDILPHDIPLKKVDKFIRATMRHQASQHRDAQIVKQLIRKEHISILETMSELHRKYSLINRRTICANPSCQRHFSADQPHARLPNGKVVHYACLKTMPDEI